MYLDQRRVTRAELEAKETQLEWLRNAKDAHVWPWEGEKQQLKKHYARQYDSLRDEIDANLNDLERAEMAKKPGGIPDRPIEPPSKKGKAERADRLWELEKATQIAPKDDPNDEEGGLRIAEYNQAVAEKAAIKKEIEDEKIAAKKAASQKVAEKEQKKVARLKAKAEKSDGSRTARVANVGSDQAKIKIADLTSGRRLEGDKYKAGTSLEGTKYKADRSLEGTQYKADRTLEGTKDTNRSRIKVAEIGLEGSKDTNRSRIKVAEIGLEGGKYKADRSLEGTQYKADRTLEGTKDTNLTKFKVADVTSERRLEGERVKAEGAIAREQVGAMGKIKVAELGAAGKAEEEKTKRSALGLSFLKANTSGYTAGF